MPQSPLGPHLASPEELKERLATERAGEPFVVYRDNHARQQIVTLSEGLDFTIGRSPDSDISLVWDDQVSGLHAELRRTGGAWLIMDDGLSLNGTHVNGERIRGRRRLRDGDQLEIGLTALIFCEPLPRRAQSTVLANRSEAPPEPSPAQRRVLVSLCRPFKSEGAFARPATNQQIAEDLTLTVAAVKTHLRALFQCFGLEDLPQNEKRARLVELALTTGAVSAGEL